MSDTVSFAELDRQHVELLPARTALSMFNAQGGLSLPQPITDLLNGFTGGMNSAPTDSNSADGAAGASQ